MPATARDNAAAITAPVPALALTKEGCEPDRAPLSAARAKTGGLNRIGVPRLCRCLVQLRPRKSDPGETGYDQRGRTPTVKDLAEPVSLELGNTPAIARKSYIHPDVLDAASSGELPKPARTTKWLDGGETALLALQEE